MSILERFLILTVLVAVGFGAYFLYQSPQVSELFGSVEPHPAVRAPKPRDARPRVAEAKPESPPAETPKPRIPAATRDPEPKPAPKPEPDPRSAVQQYPAENHQVARVLLQILAARKLAGGISLSVGDDWLEVIGETGSADDRKAILDVLDKGRANRRIIAEQLVVTPPEE